MKIPKFIRYSFSLLLLAILIYVVDFNQLWLALSQLTLPVLALLFSITILLIYTSCLKWKIFLEALGSDVSVFKLIKLYIVGYFINLIIPSYVGGDAVRSWYAGKEVGQHEAAAATILERYTGFVAMVTLALLFVWLVDVVTWQIKLTVILIFLGVAFITFLALSPILVNQLEKITKLKPILKHVRKIQSGFHLVKNNPKLLLKTMALSYLFHTITVINTMTAAHAVGWFNPPAQDLFVVLPLILLIGAIPIAPSGLGIQEGAFYFFLSGLGATPAQALGVGVILRAKTYVTALFGGLFWLQIKNNVKEEKLSVTS
jgi:uncharacterized protein (TIRG00374 family)